MQQPRVVFPIRGENSNEKLFGLDVIAYRSATEEDFRKLVGATLVALADNESVRPDIREACSLVGEFFSGDDPIGDADMDYSLLGTFETVADYIH